LLRPPSGPGRREKGILPCNEEEKSGNTISNPPYKTSTGEDDAKGVVSEVGEVKEVDKVEVDKVNNEVDEAVI
jgi:hypothetical protein